MRGGCVTLGAGVLLKGPIAPMVPLLAGVTLLVMDRRAPWFLALRPLWGVPLMIACAAPWFIAIGIATEGRFFTQALGDDMLNKVGSGEESHWGPPGFYTFLFGITAFPSAWIVLRALPGAWDFRQPGRLPGEPVDHAFSGWDGRCRIIQEDAGYQLDCPARGAAYYLLYCPSGQDFFCFEPVTHPVNAHHLPGRPGLVLLHRDQTTHLRYSLHYRPLPAS